MFLMSEAPLWGAMHCSPAAWWSWWGQLLRIIMERFQEGLVFKADSLLYHSTLGSRVTKKKKKVVVGGGFSDGRGAAGGSYRGTSLIRKRPPT